MHGRPLRTLHDVAQAAELLHRSEQDLIITMGREGLHLVTAAGKSIHQPAFAITVRSAHGAGDCFCGALAARLALGEEIASACDFARAAAALFVAATPDAQSTLSARQVHAFVAKMEKAG
jgi:ribokinase